jgi:hypothetical protein
MNNIHLTVITPKNIVARTAAAGELVIRYGAVKGSAHYEIEVTATDDKTDTRLVKTYKTRCRIQGLKPGTEYGVSVKAVVPEEAV